MMGHLVNGSIANLKQATAINMHEITSYIHLHDIARNGIVLTFLPDVLFQSFNTIMGSSVLDAAVCVVNESTFLKEMRIVVIQMVDNPVAELGGEHLAFLGVGDDKTSGRMRLIGAIEKLITQLIEIAFKILFKT